MDIARFRNDKAVCKSYAHFDLRVSLKNDRIWNYVRDAKSVAKHAFYPFISYEKDYTKFNHRKGKQNPPKKRVLSYASHIDRCIYQYYSFLISELYNQRVLSDGINDCAIAYRSNLGKNNIDFANRAFEFIKNSDDCCIVVGDFKGFFDNINHAYLKQRLCNLLQCSTLSPAFYAVFKSITKYSFCYLEDILNFLGLKNSRKSIKKLNSKKRVMSLEEFHAFKKKIYPKGKDTHHAIQRNKNDYGIPQGSPISAVFANVYLLEFDKNMYQLVEQDYHGLYMRYSDDFIVVLPGVKKTQFENVKKRIDGYVQNVPNLKLESEKTHIYMYSSGLLENVTNNFGNDGEIYGKTPKALDYLGFSFDGKVISVRDKTISKYYYRMYRKINMVKYWFCQCGTVQTGLLYDKYSLSKSRKKDSKQLLKRTAVKPKRNFLTYLRDAHMKFKGDELFERCTDRHMLKIRRRLTKVLNGQRKNNE